jgi:hypothetical protein
MNKPSYTTYPPSNHRHETGPRHVKKTIAAALAAIALISGANNIINNKSPSSAIVTAHQAESLGSFGEKQSIIKAVEIEARTNIRTDPVIVNIEAGGKNNIAFITDDKSTVNVESPFIHHDDINGFWVSLTKDEMKKTYPTFKADEEYKGIYWVCTLQANVISQ